MLSLPAPGRVPSGQPALWEQTAAGFRRDILNGTLRPGYEFPTDKALAVELGVSRETVVKAFTALTWEGLVRSGKGHPRRVADVANPLILHPGTWEQDVRARGLEPSEEGRLEIVQAPTHIASLLGATDDEAVILRHATRYASGIPVQLADAYFRESLVRGTPLTQPGGGPSSDAVFVRLGHPETRHRHRIATRLPTSHEVATLQISRGNPVLQITRIAYDPSGVPVGVLVTVTAGLTNEVVIDTPAADPAAAVGEGEGEGRPIPDTAAS